MSESAKQQYRIKAGAPVHYIHNRLFPAGSIVTLPEGVTPGMWLEAIEAPKPEAKKQDKQPAK